MLEKFIADLKSEPFPLDFTEVIAGIDRYYKFKAVAFQNGELSNAVGENTGSCKLFAFASKHKLSPEQTLRCFSEHYQNVLDNPEAETHLNIREFMQHGWDGILLDGEAISLR